MADPIVSKQDVLQPTQYDPSGDKIFTPVKEYAPPPAPSQYVEAFSSQSDVVSVSTGNASVKMFETVAPQAAPPFVQAQGSGLSDVLVLAALGLSVFILTRGKK